MKKEIGILMLMIVFSVGPSITSYASGTSSSSWDRGGSENQESIQPQTQKRESDNQESNQSRSVGSATQETNGPHVIDVVSSYDQGMQASKNNDFQKALPLFEQALQEDANNPDILNMLAHTQRKLGMIDEALANYNKALALRPKFPEAREYLGEAYIQAALREIKILKSYGKEGAESLEDLTKAFKDAAMSLE